jgi:hypothetical protein
MHSAVTRKAESRKTINRCRPISPLLDLVVVIMVNILLTCTMNSILSSSKRRSVGWRVREYLYSVLDRHDFKLCLYLLQIKYLSGLWYTDKLVSCQVVNNCLHCLFNRDLISSNMDLWLLRCLIWSRDTGELFDLACSRFLV